ncbi:hypothetical protein FACS1894202_06130 [Clostridia bacterium]|nr:hypothetical protein FACS1894202_06130 [Clostridia bacterium]
MNKRVLFIILALSIVNCQLLIGCDWRVLDTEGWTSPSPSPSVSASVPSSNPWATVPKKRYNELFGLAWDSAHITHPLSGSNRFNDDVYTLVYEGLFRLDERFEPVPMLCKSIETSDDIHFTLTLEEAAFHDGAPLSAADVVYSLKNAGFDARADGEAVAVTLNAPNARLAARLITPIVQDGSIKRSFPWAGTGPYMFVNDEHAGGEDYEGLGYHLEINTAWWRHGNLPLGRVELCDASRADDLPYKMGVGDISLAVEDLGDTFGVTYRGDFERWSYPTTILQYLSVNAASPLLGSEDARNAVSLILDRSELARTVYNGAADPALLPIPPASPLCPEYDGDDLTSNPRAFAELCEILGWEDSDFDGRLDYPSGRRERKPIELRILVSEEDTIARHAAENIQGQLLAAGIGASVDARHIGTRVGDLEDALKNGEYELYMTCADVRTSAVAASATSLGSLFETDMIPLLFRRQTLLTQRGMVSGIEPLYKQPFYNISDWTVRK